MVISGYKINKDIKSGMLKNILTRKKYKNYVMNIVLNAWFKSLIAPLFWLMILVTCFIMSGTFILRDGFGSSGIITGNTILLIILYFIYLVIHSLFCANLSLIFNEKNNNFMLNILFSYLTFFCINYYLCSILWYGVETYLSYYSSFPNYDIVAVFSLATQDFLYAGGGYLLFFIKIIVCFLISLLGVISTYYNKEKVVIECEK